VIRLFKSALLVCLLGLLIAPALAQGRPPSRRLPPPKGAAHPPQGFPSIGNGRVAGDAPQSSDEQPEPQRMGRRGPHVGAWLEQHRNQSPQQQEESLRNDPNFQNLPPEVQQRLLRRLHHFNSLSPEDQQLMLERMRKFERLSPDQRNQLRQLESGMRELPQERRKAIHQTIHQLRKMVPQDRQNFLQSDKFRSDFNEQEQKLIRGWNDLDIATETQPSEQAPNPPDMPDDGPHFLF